MEVPASTGRTLSSGAAGASPIELPYCLRLAYIWRLAMSLCMSTERDGKTFATIIFRSDLITGL